MLPVPVLHRRPIAALLLETTTTTTEPKPTRRPLPTAAIIVTAVCSPLSTKKVTIYRLRRRQLPLWLVRTVVVPRLAVPSLQFHPRFFLLLLLLRHLHPLVVVVVVSASAVLLIPLLLLHRHHHRRRLQAAILVTGSRAVPPLYVSVLVSWRGAGPAVVVSVTSSASP